MLADFFDTMGTMTAIGAEAGPARRGRYARPRQRILIVDSLAAAAGGAGGVSSNTSYIESAAGSATARGPAWRRVVTGVLFLARDRSLAPLVRAIPSEAAVPALVVVGFLMMQQVTDIDWKDVDDRDPGVPHHVLMPFTFSITVGIGAGFMTYAFIKLVRGKTAEVHPLLWGIAAVFAIYFAIAPITDLLT